MLLTKVNIDSMEKTKYELFDYKDCWFAQLLLCLKL